MSDKALLFIHALTGLHPGSGTALGVVDLPVQRERHTPLADGPRLVNQGGHAVRVWDQGTTPMSWQPLGQRRVPLRTTPARLPSRTPASSPSRYVR